jgi:hypothetical protein
MANVWRYVQLPCVAVEWVFAAKLRNRIILYCLQIYRVGKNHDTTVGAHRNSGGSRPAAIGCLFYYLIILPAEGNCIYRPVSPSLFTFFKV